MDLFDKGRKGKRKKENKGFINLFPEKRGKGERYLPLGEGGERKDWALIVFKGGRQGGCRKNSPYQPSGKGKTQIYALGEEGGEKQKKGS